jgi:hypothetical protein
LNQQAVQSNIINYVLDNGYQDGQCFLSSQYVTTFKTIFSLYAETGCSSQKSKTNQVSDFFIGCTLTLACKTLAFFALKIDPV